MLSYCKIYSEASLPCITYLRYFKEYLDEKIPLKLWKIVVIKRLRNSSYTPVYDVRPKLLLWFPQHIICPLYSISIQCFSICRLHAIQYNIGYFTLKKVIWCCWYGKKTLKIHIKSMLNIVRFRWYSRIEPLKCSRCFFCQKLFIKSACSNILFLLHLHHQRKLI